MSDKPLRDFNVGRGKRESAPLGTTLFAGLRALDPLLQRSILLSTPLTTLLPKLNLSPPVFPANQSIYPLTGLGPIQSLIWFMSIGSAVKQCYHLLFVGNEPMYATGSTIVAVFNTIFNGLNTLLFTASASLPAQFQPYQWYIGAAMYLVGMMLETLSEVQRKKFKDKPENKGKAYSGGLFSLARHINYGGYTLWRGGFALAAGGPIWGALVTLFFASDFANRAIPVLDQYCSARYGTMWQDYKRQVRWKLLPGIY